VVHRRAGKTLAAVFGLAVLAGLVVGGCTSQGCNLSPVVVPQDTGNGPGGAYQIPYGTVRLTVRLPESLSVREAVARLIPNATRLLRITVSAADLAEDIVVDVPLDEAHGATETVDVYVPSGTNRTCLIAAFDGSATPQLLAQESVIITVVAAQVTTVSVTLAPEGWVYPTTSATVVPSSVPVGESVSFGGSGADADGSIVKYEWDFDGDGTYDWEGAVSATASYAYDASGTYGAVLRVTDDDGLTGESDPVNVSVGQRLSVSVLTLDFGEAGVSMDLTIDDTAVPPCTDFNWSVSGAASWLTRSAGSGTITDGGEATVTFTLNRSTLAAGTYNDTVTVTSDDGSASISAHAVQSVVEFVVD